MGIGKGPAILLMKEAKRKPFHGSLLTLGRQSVLISPYQLRNYSKLAKFPLNLPKSKDDYAEMSDKDFFPLLGFSEVKTLDYSDYEDASIKFDLNSGALPEIYKDAFDTIYDGGTIEHVFHLPNALKSLIWMLKPGGRLIHLSPASNHLEHSFYMFSPTFYHDFYSANKFQIDSIQIVGCTPCFDYKYHVYDYKSLCLSNTDIGMGRLDNRMYMVHSIVTKTPNSTYDAIPNQSIYSSHLWNQNPPLPSIKDKIKSKKAFRKWKQIFKQSPIYPIWAFCKLKLRKYGVPLKLNDRF